MSIAQPPSSPITKPWQDSVGKRVLVAVSFPVFFLLNRPSLRWFARAAYDFALRCRYPSGTLSRANGRDKPGP